MTNPAENHSRAAARFADCIAGTADWTVATPVKEWQARDIVVHLLDWFPGLLASGSEIRLPDVDTGDLASAWAERSADVQSFLDDPDVIAAPFTSPMFGDITIGGMVDQFYTADIVMHTWDLARATRQDDTLPQEFVAGAYEGMSAMADVIRSSGQFGDQQPVADDAPLQDRFIAFIGRDPAWQPIG